MILYIKYLHCNVYKAKKGHEKKIDIEKTKVNKTTLQNRLNVFKESYAHFSIT